MTGNDGNLFESEGYELMGAAFEVYNELGAGFLEEVYQEALQRVLIEKRIPFIAQPRLEVWFRGSPLTKFYVADFLVYGEIIVELKAARAIAPEHEAQLLNELRATNKRIGYVINFGAFPKLQWSRRVL
jgi:GxxExxY protein